MGGEVNEISARRGRLALPVLVALNRLLFARGGLRMFGNMSGGGSKSMTFEELAQQRRNTELIAKLLREQLAKYLETLRPIFVPERVLGKYTGAKADVPGSDRVFADLQQKVRDFSKQPFDLPTELDAQWLTLVGNRLELYPWEYRHEAKTEKESRGITMTAPVKWIVTYASNYSAQQ